MTDLTPEQHAALLREYADRTTGYIYQDEVAVLREAADALTRLAADTERLREALRLIADHGHELDGYVLPPKRARAIARAALAPPAETEQS